MADDYAKGRGLFPIEYVPDIDFAMEQAYLGNYAPLIERLRSTTVLLPQDRALAADIIEKKLKRPAHRPPQRDHAHLALHVGLLMQRGAKEKAAVAQTAEVEKVSVATVRKAVAAYPDWLGGLPRRARPKKVSNK